MDTATLMQENQTLQERVRALASENQLLRRKVDALLKRLYGVHSEKISEEQLELLMAGLSAPPPVPGPPPPGLCDPPTRSQAPRTSPARRGLPKHLETEEVVLVPDAVKAAPQDFKKIGEEITEELDYTPARFFRRLFIRPKYVPVPQPQPQPQAAASARARTGSDVVTQALADLEAKAVVIAPLPPRLIKKGYPGPGLLAHIVISKYEDHLPLYRQEKIYRQR